MPIKIHHGPPGSYKTAGAVADDFIPAAKQGRVVVTNVRGLSRDSVLEQFPDLPESFDVISVDTSTAEGREKLARWFHWVPHGAFLLIDEAQMIWPSSWRQSDLDLLDYPGGVDVASADNRPSGWAVAWEMHRHYNWDFTLTTPSIKKIRSDIRQCCETAFKHKNLAIVGFKGRYLEGYHLADDDGSSNAQFLSLNPKKIPQYVWSIYQSTATGSVTDSKAGLSFLKNPRLVFIFFSVLVCMAFVFYNGLPSYFKGVVDDDSKAVKVSSSTSPSASPGFSVPVDSSFSRRGDNVDGFRASKASSDQGDINHGPLSGSHAYIQAGLQRPDGTYKYLVNVSGKSFSSQDLKDAGYMILPLGFCLLELNYRGEKSYIKCSEPGGAAPVQFAKSGI